MLFHPKGGEQEMIYTSPVNPSKHHRTRHTGHKSPLPSPPPSSPRPPFSFSSPASWHDVAEDDTSKDDSRYRSPVGCASSLLLDLPAINPPTC